MLQRRVIARAQCADFIDAGLQRVRICGAVKMGIGFVQTAADTSDFRGGNFKVTPFCKALPFLFGQSFSSFRDYWGFCNSVVTYGEK